MRTEKVEGKNTFFFPQENPSEIKNICKLKWLSVSQGKDTYRGNSEHREQREDPKNCKRGEAAADMQRRDD